MGVGRSYRSVLLTTSCGVAPVRLGSLAVVTEVVLVAGHVYIGVLEAAVLPLVRTRRVYRFSVFTSYLWVL